MVIKANTWDIPDITINHVGNAAKDLAKEEKNNFVYQLDGNEIAKKHYIGQEEITCYIKNKIIDESEGIYKGMKKISFVVIAYNEERNIANCMRVILNQRGLKNSDYEIIIVNDGSRDKTADIIIDLSKKSKRIQLVNLKENRGRGFARHVGVGKAKGDYIVFVDADITLPENWLVRIMPLMEQFDAVGGVATPEGDIMYICENFKLEPKPLLATTGITGNNVIYRSEVLKKIGFSPEIKDGEDTDLNWRLKRAGYKIKLLEDLIVTHKENISFKKSLKRIFSYGKGATKLFNRHKKLRLPDLIF